MQDRDDLLFLIWFQYVIEGLYLISLEYKVRIGGNKNNLRCGSPFPYLPRGCNAVQILHLYIQKYNIKHRVVKRTDK